MIFFVIQLGLGEIYDRSAANFSGMITSKEPLHVSKVIQKVFFQVNEDGSDAPPTPGEFLFIKYVVFFVYIRLSVVGVDFYETENLRNYWTDYHHLDILLFEPSSLDPQSIHYRHSGGPTVADERSVDHHRTAAILFY